MNIGDFTDILMTLLPAIIIAAVASYFFKRFIDNENDRRQFLIRREIQKETLPARLQAYERITLFLERISPNNLLTRVKPNNLDAKGYADLLAATIEQEFDHNLTQQIYLSDDCWGVVLTAKNATIQLIRKTVLNENVATADNLRTEIISDVIENPAPSAVALSYIKNEISALW